MAGNLKLLAGTHTAAQNNTSGTLANAAAVAAATATIANQTNLDRFMSFVLTAGFSVAPAVNAEVQLYLVPALDGTNFADEDTTTPTLSANQYVGSFFVDKSQTGAQLMVVERVRVGPFLYKAYILNKTAQTIAAAWLLDVYGESAQYT